MKKLLLLLSVSFACYHATAQSSMQAELQSGVSALAAAPVTEEITAGKVAKNGDTLQKANFTSTDSLKRYIFDFITPKDSGYLGGVNVFGDKGFAERFDIKGSDSSVLPLGVGIWFAGTASATSTMNLTVAAWNQGPTTRPVAARTHLYFTGVPTTTINSLNVPLTSIRKSSGSIDSFRLFRFANPGTNYIADSFFVGFTIPYTYASLNGDTVSVYMTQINSSAPGRHQPGYLIIGSDTLVNVQNATQLQSGAWVDNLNGAIQGGHVGTYNGYIMTALFRVKTLGIDGISRNDLTVFGTYPNPSSDNAKMKLALKTATDVTLTVVDAAGRTVYTQAPLKLSNGTHELDIPTSQFAAGTYFAVVRTAEGDSMGIEMVVTR